MKKFLMIFLLIFSLTKIILAETAKVTILYTNNTNGSLEPCGCPGNKAGGMAQRMTIIKKEREKDPNLLLLDAGDFFNSTPNIYHPEAVIDIMNLMKYDVVALGDQEFVNGLDYLQKQLPRMKFDLVSSNIFLKDTKERIVPNEYVIKTVNGVKIAIIGVLSNNVFTFFPKDKIGNLDIKDPVGSTGNLIRKFHEEADIVIVLSHQSSAGDRNYANALYWIDAMITGHDGTFFDNPSKKTNGISLFQAGKNGEYVGKLIFEYDTSTKKVVSMKSESIFVEKKSPKDPEIDKMIQEFDKNIPVYVDTMGKNKLLGVGYCRKCHTNEVNIWARSRHYAALMTIKNQKTLMHSNSCYTCHVTNLDSNDVFGIECESCHTIVKNHENIRDKSELKITVCLKCHTKDRSPNFDFEKYKEKIYHGKKRKLDTTIIQDTTKVKNTEIIKVMDTTKILDTTKIEFDTTKK